MSESLKKGLVDRFVESASQLRTLDPRASELRGTPVRTLLQKVANLGIVRPAAYVIRRLGYRQDVITRVKFLAADDAAHYVLEHMMPCAVFDDRYPLFELGLRQAPPTGLVLEFGVFNARSTNFLAKRIPDRHIYGFDSFEGLAEDWGGTGYLKGGLSVNSKLPKVRSNITLIEGWFDRTLEPFLAENPGPVAFAHLDADTYGSTKYVLGKLAPRFVAGTVLQFDEYLGYPGWRTGEFQAFQEICAELGIAYRYLGIGYLSVAIQITSPGRARS